MQIKFSRIKLGLWQALDQDGNDIALLEKQPSGVWYGMNTRPDLQVLFVDSSLQEVRKLIRDYFELSDGDK